MSADNPLLAGVLVVDDAPDMRSALQALLRLHGYEVRTAADGAEAVTLQRVRPARLLITDLFMPGQEGMETIALFRREWPAMKIIAVSGGGDRTRNSYLPAARMAGADAALRKPFPFSMLIDTMRAIAA